MPEKGIYYLKSLKRLIFLKLGSKYIILATALLVLILLLVFNERQKELVFKKQIDSSKLNELQAKKELAKINEELSILKNEDQYKINRVLKEQIGNIEKTYKKAVDSYEEIQDLKAQKGKTTDLEKDYIKSLSYLSELNYASADAMLNNVFAGIQKEKERLVPQASENLASLASAPFNNTPPGSGYSKQTVNSEIGAFVVDIVAADLNSTRVIVDTASESDCRDNCPVLSLADYVGRNGAFAGVNGSYFCPAAYPSCAGKTNSFDTLLMNKNKKYFNSDNNVYSSVPAVIFSGNSVRYVGRSLEWGRDTGIDAVLANQPLLVMNGQVVFGGDGEVKRAGKGSRSFVGNTGSTVYIGVVHSVSAEEMARVLKSMGIQNALNLDSGGSTALWSAGYKVGPGRNIPNAILFIHK